MRPHGSYHYKQTHYIYKLKV
uniref:Uncharacterized protein n=1 Tax=Anguilla anguilla TaxID=7936 RepID=A0A0E9PRU0_ANGAN